MASTAARAYDLRARELDDPSRPAWRDLVTSHAASRAIVPRWEELSGWRTHAIAAFSGSRITAGLDVAVRRIPKLPLTLSRVSRLMLEPGREAETLEVLLDELERFAARHLTIETELRLRIPATDSIDGFANAAEIDRLLRAYGYRPLDKVDSTYVVRIDRDDDALMASFDSTTRNKIRKAKKDGASVTVSHDYALLHDFYEAYLHMSERKQVSVPPRVFMGEGMVPLLHAGDALMVIESYAERVSNMVIVDALGIPCYALGARTRQNVAGEVPGAAQVLHFEIMRELRARGHKYYDLGGCEGPVPVEGHPNFGVWRFKYRFGGTFVRFLPYYRKTRVALLRPVLDAVHRLRGDYV